MPDAELKATAEGANGKGGILLLTTRSAEGRFFEQCESEELH
jgi:hypothetical protein